MSEQTPEQTTEASVPTPDGSTQAPLPLETSPSATPQASPDPAASDASAQAAANDSSASSSDSPAAAPSQSPATQEPATNPDASSTDEQTTVVEQAPADAEFTHMVELPEQPQKSIDLEIDVATIEHESNVVLFGIEAHDAVAPSDGGCVIFRFVHKRNNAPFGTMSAVVVTALEEGQRLVVEGIVPQPFLPGDIISVVMSQQGFGLPLPAGIIAGIVTA